MYTERRVRVRVRVRTRVRTPNVGTEYGSERTRLYLILGTVLADTKEFTKRSRDGEQVGDGSQGSNPTLGCESYCS